MPTPSSTPRQRYDFDSLRHGQAIAVVSKKNAWEAFRHWKKARGKPGRLVSSQENPSVLYFLSETPQTASSLTRV